MTKDQIHHVYPVNDEKKHLLECERVDTDDLPYCACRCRPTHQEVGNAIQGITGLIVIHNSFDGREGVEWANEIINQTNKI
jgi:hypothetical protein